SRTTDGGSDVTPADGPGTSLAGTAGSTTREGAVAEICVASVTWQTRTPCPFLCRAGACAGACVPGELRCDGNVPQRCDADGAWLNGEPCAGVCTTGTCAGSCEPGAKQCSGNTPQACTTGGAWQD